MKINDLKNELNNEKQLTENGAVGYRTAGKELLDLNFMTSSLRNMSESDIYNRFLKAFYENKLLAVKWLYFLRDIRGGMGERRSFRVILQRLAHDHPKLVKEFIEITAEYGRYDDLWCLLDTDLRDDVIKYCYLVLLKDIKNVKDGKPITLLGKWLPSLSSKKEDKVRYAKMFAKGFNLSEKNYSKTLKMLREYSNVVECKMSAGKWNEIDYSAVPSKANIIYRNAFYKHDEERRQAYLNSLSKGEAKINGEVNFPHDIVHNYMKSHSWYSNSLKPYDESLEQLWKTLPDYVNGDESTIVVKDGSGSMLSEISNTSVTAMDVADALAIYFAEKCSGEYHNSFITFSRRPKLIDMSKCENLREKLIVAKGYNEVSNTNIEAVFDLILNVAIKNNYSQDELPKNILIISDMEFDSCANNNRGDYLRYNNNATLFDEIAGKYAQYGYKIPRMVFWNLMSRTGTIPVKENNLGVSLVSGFSPVVIKMVLSGKLDPYECLLEQLNSERYLPIELAFNRVK